MARLRWLVVLVLGLSLLAGCGSSSDGDAPAGEEKARGAAGDGVEANGPSVAEEGDEASDEASSCPDAQGTAPTMDDVAAELPDGIELEADTEAMEVRKGTVIGSASGELGDVLARYRAQAVAAGYEVTKVDNEGHEAELSLRRSDGDRAEIRLRRASCPEASTTVVILAGD